MKFPGQRARAVAGLCLAVVVLAAAAVVGEIGARAWRETGLRADIEPRHARLSGVLERGDAILAAGIEASAALGRLAYLPDADIGQIGTDLQQRIRQLAESAELRVAGSQILPVREKDGFSVVTVTGTLEGETGALGAFLLALAAEQPPIAVEKLAVQAPRMIRRGAENNASVSIQMNMSVLRLAP
jgi:general secretion pathway protein M